MQQLQHYPLSSSLQLLFSSSVRDKQLYAWSFCQNMRPFNLCVCAIFSNLLKSETVTQHLDISWRHWRYSSARCISVSLWRNSSKALGSHRLTFFIAVVIDQGRIMSDSLTMLLVHWSRTSECIRCITNSCRRPVLERKTNPRANKPHASLLQGTTATF